jgi:Sigma-70, region 4
VRDVQRLPRDQREALLLFELGDSSHDEIATILGVRREKVKALVFQARETLMGWRAARDTPCEQVREQLATLRGSALRRASIRRHVEQCAGCAAYEREVGRQRAALAVALPVVPGAGLKAAILASTLGGSGVAVGAGAATGGLALKGVGAKVLAIAAVAGTAGTGGYVAVEHLQDHRGKAPAREEQATRAVRATAVALHAGVPAIRAPAASTTGAAATPASPAAKPKAKRARGRALGKSAAHGKAAAPGQLKAPGSPAQGKALGHLKHKTKRAKPAHVEHARKQGATTTRPKRARKAAKPKHVAVKRAPKAAVKRAPKAVSHGGGKSSHGGGKH